MIGKSKWNDIRVGDAVQVEGGGKSWDVVDVATVTGEDGSREVTCVIFDDGTCVLPENAGFRLTTILLKKED